MAALAITAPFDGVVGSRLVADRSNVAANTGAVTARRSDLWRLYDSLWALHIMDWRDHENFNHPLIIAVTAITLLSVIAGIVLIPYRIRFRKLRPRVGESRS